MPSWVEHEKSFITSGPGHTQTSLLIYIDKLDSRKLACSQFRYNIVQFMCQRCPFLICELCLSL